MEPVELIAAAVKAVSEIEDPVERFKAATELDAQLLEGRTLTADIRARVVQDMRGPGMGLLLIARALGITKTRAQQLANKQV
jgi:hypothetical protein